MSLHGYTAAVWVISSSDCQYAQSDYSIAALVLFYRIKVISKVVRDGLGTADWASINK